MKHVWFRAVRGSYSSLREAPTHLSHQTPGPREIQRRCVRLPQWHTPNKSYTFFLFCFCFVRLFCSNLHLKVDDWSTDLNFVSWAHRLLCHLSKAQLQHCSGSKLQLLRCPSVSDGTRAETSQSYRDPHNTHMKLISSTAATFGLTCALGTCMHVHPSPLPSTAPDPSNCYHIFSPSSCLSFPAGLDLLLMLTLVLSSGFRLLLFPEKLYKKVWRFLEARHNIYTREDRFSLSFSFLCAAELEHSPSVLPFSPVMHLMALMICSQTGGDIAEA